MNLFLFGVGLFGLMIGSFLNVVIARLPIMLLQEEKEEPESTPFNLAFPASHCPQCKQSIAWFDNIPLLSFICLKGQCRHCHQTISARYPLIEALTVCLSVIVAIRYGFTPTAFAALGLTWALIALSFIDYDTKLLPDHITLSFLWIGLLVNAFNLFTTPGAAIIGAAGGYMILWAVYWSFKILTQKEGMGYGDFKLLAMLGAWLGWQSLPFIILVSSSLGAVVGLSLIFFKKYSKNTPIPFGPFLALAGFIALLYGPDLYRFYIKWLNLSLLV